MVPTETYRTLLADVQKALEPSRFMLIGIEGPMLAGKTHLADQLDEDLGLSVPALHVDDFRPKPIPNLPYLGTLDLRELALDLYERRQDFPTTPVIIEGICLREVLERLGRKLDLAIYVKKLSPQGLWHFQ